MTVKTKVITFGSAFVWSVFANHDKLNSTAVNDGCVYTHIFPAGFVACLKVTLFKLCADSNTYPTPTRLGLYSIVDSSR